MLFFITAVRTDMSRQGVEVTTLTKLRLSRLRSASSPSRHGAWRVPSSTFFCIHAGSSEICRGIVEGKQPSESW